MSSWNLALGNPAALAASHAQRGRDLGFGYLQPDSRRLSGTWAAAALESDRAQKAGRSSLQMGQMSDLAANGRERLDGLQREEEGNLTFCNCGDGRGFDASHQSNQIRIMSAEHPQLLETETTGKAQD